MATEKKEIKSAYPLPVYNYRMTILPGSFLEIASGTTRLENSDAVSVISCSEVSGLFMEVETTIYKHGFSFLTGFQVIPGQRKEVHLSIKKGITTNGSYFSDWIKLIYPFTMPLPFSLSRKRDILIDLCDEKGEPVVRWIVIKAMPTKLEAPTFDATTNEVAFEKMDFIAHQLKIEYINSN
jgi:phage tail-like protein